ncbi:MAG TPA: hypothetical protein VN622_12260 [Clostridia bacterium]|nr:hypothetical protein [Clostridia bacterium]
MNSPAIVALLLLLTISVFAQQTPSGTAAKKPTSSRAPSVPAASASDDSATSANPGGAVKSDTSSWPQYCSDEAGFCVNYPQNWKRLGEVFQGAGMVVALPQAGVEQELWTQVTAAAVALPDEPEGKERPAFEDVVNVVLESVEPGRQKQTLHRSALTLDGFSAQMVKVQYADAGGKPWVEEVVFIDGDDVIYSLALRCAPKDVAAVEPVFLAMVDSWKASASAPKTPPAPPARTTKPAAAGKAGTPARTATPSGQTRTQPSAPSLSAPKPH